MLVRDERHGLAVYLTRRSNSSRFMPSAYVFPGGAVDPSDAEPAMLARVHGTVGDAPPPVVVAALRELLEEAGILFVVRDPQGSGTTTQGSHTPLDERLASDLRARMIAKVPFATLLAENELALDATQLVYYSNWITPPTQEVRFDTHFFLAHAPGDQVPSADAVEVHDGTWFSPADALRRAERGDLSIIFPTLKHLERLARFDRIEPLFAHARERRIVPTRPFEGTAGEIGLTGQSDAW